jgi:hypothetical protein
MRRFPVRVQKSYGAGDLLRRENRGRGGKPDGRQRGIEATLAVLIKK